ncbi:MAG: PIN domain-containing protein [bacterium]
MRKQRIYLDTSVIGGYFDPEFELWSKEIVRDFRNGKFCLVMSNVTAAEIEHAPEPVQELHEELSSISDLLEVNEEALELLAAYEERNILSSRFRNDMLHIALATVAEVDVLVSWNFRHIVRLDNIQRFNGVNLELGYKTLAIYSPREVTTYERENTDKDD